MIEHDSSLRDVAFIVCTGLDAVGVTAVLSGGAAAAIYAPSAIQSYDLDFVLQVYAKDAAPEVALAELGFRLKGQEYVHSRSPFRLDFPRGPLAVGGERIETWTTLREGDQLLHVICSTDSCRDRLAAFYHFHDASALDQALEIARANGESVDVGKLRAWSEREGSLDEFGRFERALS